MNTLQSIYYNPTTGYLSEDKLWRKAREIDPNVPRKDVREFLQNQTTWQITKEPRRPRKYRTIVASYPGENYQMDVVVYDRYEMNHYKYIICCVDVYSRYAMCLPLTNMTAETLLLAIQKIFKVMGIPKNLNFDQQFSTAKILLDYFSQNNITLYASETDELHKNAIVERFNRTLAGMIQKWRFSQNDRRWYLILPKIVESYNNNYHSTIKAKPVDVWNRVEKNHQSPIYRFAPEFKIGDHVRAMYEKRTFDKGDVIKYTKEIYVIIGQPLDPLGHPKPNRFTLRNISTGAVLKKAHKDYELIKANNVAPKPSVKKYKEYEPTTYQGTRSRNSKTIVMADRSRPRKAPERLDL